MVSYSKVEDIEAAPASMSFSVIYLMRYVPTKVSTLMPRTKLGGRIERDEIRERMFLKIVVESLQKDARQRKS